MAPDPKADLLVGCVADDEMLAGDLTALPAGIGRPEAIPPYRRRGQIVALGATMTGVSLVAGIALLVIGVIGALSSGIGGTAAIALVLGVILTGTHWGWVHVAEATANAMERNHNSEVIDRRRLWVQSIEPYARYEIATSVGEDGSITITRVGYRPVRRGERGFVLVRETELTEVHSGDEPAAAVTERAELLRRQAALDTARERERFEAASGVYQTAALAEADEREQIEARRRASAALSDQINANLRDPPLSE